MKLFQQQANITDYTVKELRLERKKMDRGKNKRTVSRETRNKTKAGMIGG